MLYSKTVICKEVGLKHLATHRKAEWNMKENNIITDQMKRGDSESWAFCLPNFKNHQPKHLHRLCSVSILLKLWLTSENLKGIWENSFPHIIPQQLIVSLAEHLCQDDTLQHGFVHMLIYWRRSHITWHWNGTSNSNTVFHQEQNKEEEVK